MFNIFKKNTLPKSAKKSLEPSAEFLLRNKTVFLTAFKGKFAPFPEARHFGFAAKAFASVLALFVATGGAAVYADTANVSADSPLYPLKRFHESVQLVLANHNDKAQLQVTLAERRTKEIEEIQQKDPQSALLPSLTNDLHDAIDNSIGDAEKNDLQDGKLVDFCDKLLAAASTSSLAAIREEILSHPKVFARFDNRCGEIETNENDDINGEASGTISVAATTTAPEVTSTNKGPKVRPASPAIRGGENRQENEGDSANIKSSVRKTNAKKYRELNLDFQNRLLNAAAGTSSTEGDGGAGNGNSSGSRPRLDLRNSLRGTIGTKSSGEGNSGESEDSLNATMLSPEGRVLGAEKDVTQPPVPVVGGEVTEEGTVSAPTPLKIGIFPKTGDD